MLKSIHENPFRTLGASTDDERRRLIALADEAALFGTEGAEAALTALLNSQRRLDAEMSWFPGVGSERAEALLAYGDSAEPAPFPPLDGMGALARLNACRVLLEAWELPNAAAGYALCASIAIASDEATAERIMAEINDSRRRAGMQLLTDIADIADRLAALRRAVVHRLLERLDAMPGAQTCGVIALVARHYDKTRSPMLDALVGEYELRHQDESGRLAEAVAAACGRLAATMEYHACMVLHREVMAALQQWHTVTEPVRRIQLVKGYESPGTVKVFQVMHQYVIDMQNQHRVLTCSIEAANEMKKVFFDLPRATPVVDDLIRQLEEIRQKQMTAMGRIT
ncbi:MAG: hypothetical protein J6K32_00525 [Clostridia bacterium]|nr:hypothetical protein [Clostridia bacterium]